jgi:putative addiction module CopG family antidote
MTIDNQDVEQLIAEQLNTGRYRSADEVVLEGLKLLQARETRSSTPRANQVADLAALAAELTKDIPDSEWDKIPRDFAQNHDHYLYGAPKTS